MTKITNIKAREILDSRGHPTIEVEMYTKNNMARASVPSGASTGSHEAFELRDHKKRYNGLGVQNVVRNVEKKIFPLLKGHDCTKQRTIDQIMINADKTDNKSKFGANAILAVSLANAKLAALEKQQPLFQHINNLFSNKVKPKMPLAHFNVINGGRHADNKLSFQEFMIVPQLRTFKENLRMASEVYHMLKKDLHKKFGKGATNIGDEGGFAPVKFHKTVEAVRMLQKAIKNSGYKDKVKIALDSAASTCLTKGKYHIDRKKLTKDKLLAYYTELVRRYPSIVSIEDPFDQEDFLSFAALTKKLKIQIVGDDLTVSNVDRIEEAIREKSCNCLLLKVNQIGTLTEALDAANLAYDNNWKVMVSHRSGETTDDFIADLAVGIAAQIKAGAPCRGERLAKYNQLLRIEEILHSKSF
ncbi:phosphopyruvate hydratase [Candidatus Woesearchaeota archaeon]|nr:phosphopyruvate hydratase [Candidatus Woesearchaeota archaeon]